MRKICFLSVVLLAVSAWAIAQQGANSQSAPNSSQGSAQTAPSENSVQGCLGGSGDNFTVTDKGGTAYQLQLPAGADTANLKPHIGEEVRVTGTMANNSGSSAGGASSGQPTIAVKNIYRVASSCSSKTQGANPPKQ